MSNDDWFYVMYQYGSVFWPDYKREYVVIHGRRKVVDWTVSRLQIVGEPSKREMRNFLELDPTLPTNIVFADPAQMRFLYVTRLDGPPIE